MKNVNNELIKEKIVKIQKEVPRKKIQKMIRDYFTENQINTDLGIPVKDLRPYIGKNLGLTDEEINAGYGPDNMNILNDKILRPNLRKLTEEGILKNVQYQPALYVLQQQEFNELENDPELGQFSLDISIDETIGYGSESVYVLYYPAYERLAEINNVKIWEHKIGKTTHSNPVIRIRQTAGSPPETPKIPLSIRTDDSNLLEQIIHRVLKFREKHIQNITKREWFKTNKDEIKNIYLFITEKEEINEH